MRRSLTLALSLFTMALSPPSWADSYAPFGNFRQIDATGRYYIVVKKNGGPQDPGAGTPVTFQIAERKPGSAPVVPAEDEGRRRTVVANRDVTVREGDLILGSGRLDRSPAQIVISSTGLGFVGLDVRGYNYGDVRSNDALVVVSGDGRIRHRKAMIDLFSEQELHRFVRTAGSIWWSGGGWIDENRKEVVVLGSREFPEMEPIPRLFRVVSLETGEVRKGSSDVVLTALAETNRGALDEALDLAAELRLVKARPDLVRIFSDDPVPIESRLRAAVALAALGDRRGGELMKRIAFERSPGQKYAIEHLPLVIGDEAAVVLCDVVRKFGKKWSGTAWQAMHQVSAQAAVSPLIQLVRDDVSAVATDFAVESLGIMGPAAKLAVPELIKLLERKPKTDDLLSTPELAALALGRIGPDAKDALPALIRLAEKHAPAEWGKVKDNQPEARKNAFGDAEYSDDGFVDAICKIRAK